LTPDAGWLRNGWDSVNDEGTGSPDTTRRDHFGRGGHVGTRKEHDGRLVIDLHPCDAPLIPGTATTHSFDVDR